MSVTYGDRSKPSRTQEILEEETAETDPASPPHGPGRPQPFEPSDGELLARAEG